MRSRSVGVPRATTRAVAGVEPLHDPLDGAALAGGVATFEDDHDPQALVDDPLLHPDQLGLQAGQLLLVGGLGHHLRAEARSAPAGPSSWPRGRPGPSTVLRIESALRHVGDGSGRCPDQGCRTLTLVRRTSHAADDRPGSGDRAPARWSDLVPCPYGAGHPVPQGPVDRHGGRCHREC